ncbi:uncharacterized protein LOC133912959 [Phragmites australis]|uniref:uncharacterized protein LOC133912959 n=1 Tax=Phragmites australis TaxID=29695 RepID=UPI002D7A173E|nr:uncharacterized protein LOC133912959 [Phragmites australis]
MALPSWSTERALAHHSEMRAMTSPPLLSLSPSPCSLLLRRLRRSRAPRRRNPNPLPPLRRRIPLPLLPPAAMSSASATTAPDCFVADPGALGCKVAAIRAAGPAKLQVIADFDGTLTRYWYDGARGQSSHGLLRQGNEEYDAKREALYEHYHPIEICPDIPLPEKAKLMEEWWEKTHGLLIEGGLTYEAIKKSVADASIAFRDGVVELFEFMEERDIPVLVFSAGLADIIEEVFRQKLHLSFKNIKIVSNRMVFNEEGRLVAFKGKTIHVLNKNEHALDMADPVHDNLGDPNGSIDDYSLVKKRTNVLLLGDHIGDLGMSDGLNYENRIAVGFLNTNIEKSLKDYSKAFDIVYLNDAPMWGVVELVSELCT